MRKAADFARASGFRRVGIFISAYSDQSELTDFKPGELAALLDDVKALKRHFRVPNPTARIDNEQMHAAHDRPRIGLLTAG